MQLVSPTLGSNRLAPTGRIPRLTETVKRAIANLGNERNQLVNGHLLALCHAIQLPDSDRQRAELVYADIAQYLLDHIDPERHANPTVYPQGSMRQGTTVRPLKGDVFDLDAVLELRENPGDPVEFLRETHTQIVAWHRERGERFQAKLPLLRNRCIEIGFTGASFSMDVVPARMDGDAGGTHIFIVDKSLKGWKSSNPKGLADWFDDRNQIQFRLLKEAAELRASGTVEPLEPEPAVIDKPVLRLVVQLAKRARDQYHREDDPEHDVSTPSVLLTVLIAERYRGSANLAGALLQAAHDLRSVALQSPDPPDVYNPSNPQEVISEKWRRDREAWTAFGAWTEDFLTRIMTICASTDVTALRRLLGETFGERDLQAALRDMGRATDRAVQDLRQPVDPQGRVLPPLEQRPSKAAAVARIAPATTFYGR